MPARQRYNLSCLLQFWLPVLIWMGLIFYSSSIPGKDIPMLFPWQDVFFHSVVYLVLGLLLTRAHEATFLSWGLMKIILATCILGVGYAVFDELHQGLIPQRQCSLFDVLVDSLGVTIGSAIFALQKILYG